MKAYNLKTLLGQRKNLVTRYKRLKGRPSYNTVKLAVLLDKVQEKLQTIGYKGELIEFKINIP